METNINQNLLNNPDNSNNNNPNINNLNINNIKPQLLTFNQDDYDLDNSLHPTICLLTFIFKAGSFITYLIFATLFLSGTMTFILTTLLSTIDFWIIKNISGRMLVGLRWWRSMDPATKQEGFRFECDTQHTTIFWSSQILATLGWLGLMVLNILGLNFYWAILTGLQFILGFINLYGYYLCRTVQFIQEHQKQLKDVQSYLTAQGINQFQQVQGYVINHAIQQYQKNSSK